MEVLVASLGSGGWIGLKNDSKRGALLAGLCGDERIDDISAEEFGARVLGHYYRLAHSYLGDIDAIVDHSEFTVSVVDTIVKLFDLENVEASALRHELSLDAKRRNDLKYSDDSLSKQVSATPIARTAVARFASAAYEELLAARRQ
jgi:hypothetical protein